MSAVETKDWLEANQRYLMARLAVVREMLEQHTRGAEQNPSETEPGGAAADDEKSGEDFGGAIEEESGRASGRASEQANEEADDDELDEAARALPAPPALDSLCDAFGLSPFERDVLLLCAGIELDSSFAALCAAAGRNSQRAFPTFALALAALVGAHWSALTPAAPLRRWRFIEVTTGETLTAGALRIDERVLHYLTGVSYLDARLQGLVEKLPPHGELPGSHRELAGRVANLAARFGKTSAWPAINFCGDDRDGMRAVAACAGASLRMQLHSIRASDIPTSVAERDALSRLWEREAVLMNSALFIDYDEPEHARAVGAFIESVRGMIFVASREPLRQSKRRAVRFDVNKPAAAEQRELWQSALGQVAPQLNGHLETLTAQFSFGAEGIRAASAQALQGLLSESDGEASRKEGAQEALDLVLWDACRMQARSRLDDLAQRIEPVAGWDDLVLPEAQLQTLRAVVAQVHARSRVYEDWGFAARGGRGLGISALFAGASGTGKTMAAEVIARELRLDLYRIDLSQVVNKYIGETEKNLRRVFDAAEEGGAVLLFDEADALFGKRSEVKDSHDRYANIEISYLLQRMEEYRGLAILTTNLKSVLDPAFMRRLRFVVHFPFPDHAQRAAIWQRIFPEETPTENLDVSKLARLSVAGGNIRNIALNAAFLAAHDQDSVRMSHLLRAARGEYAKLEKNLADSEIAGWA
jgi:hypothetical protein